MKFHKLLFLNYSGREFGQEYWDKFKDLCEELVMVSNENLLEAQNLDADGLLVKLGAKVDKTIIDSFSNLKYIGMLGTGIGGIDKVYASSKNVTVANITDYATEGVAEFIFGALLNNLRELERSKKQA